MPFVLSKLSADVRYTAYSKGEGGMLRPVGQVLVRGGAGIANRRTLLTPDGVVTEITTEEANRLKNDPVFAQHAEAGVVKILLKRPQDPATEAADLAQDASAPLTPDDYVAEGKTPPTTGAAPALAGDRPEAPSRSRRNR